MEKFVNFQPAKPTDQKKVLLDKKSEMISWFISRIAQKTEGKIKTLKTKKGIENNINGFIENIKSFENELDKKSYEYFNKLIKYFQETYLKISPPIVNEISSESTYQKQQEEYKKQKEKDEREYQICCKGIEAEDNGDTELAIKYYEQLVTCKFDGTHPYNRLCIIYRKQKRYDDEIRVIKSLMNVYPQNHFETINKFIWFKDRLKKAEELKNKIPS